MTYITSQPYTSNAWDDICYPIAPVWLTDILPDYDIVATDRQQLIVGQPHGGRKTVFGIQSADYAIIPNEVIRQVVDQLFNSYSLQIKHTATGEFSISIIFDEQTDIGKEKLQRSLILTNSYNGKTPFTVQGQTLPVILDSESPRAGSMYRELCQNGLMGWADSFDDLSGYQHWLKQKPAGKLKPIASKSKGSEKKTIQKDIATRKIHHSRLTPDLFQQQLHTLLSESIRPKHSLTAEIYSHLQQRTLTRSDENLLKTLPIPVQLAKQAHERLRIEERMMGVNPSYWLLYNAVNYSLFTARSSLTLNDRYKLDEKVFHGLAARSFA